MSPVLIGSLVLGVVVFIIGVAFVNQSMERAKLDKARKIAECVDRAKRYGYLLNGFPPNYVHTQLLSLLANTVASNLVMAAKLSPGNERIEAQLKKAKAQQQHVDSLPAQQPNPAQLHSKEEADEVRRLLDELNRFVVTAAKQGSLSKKDASAHMESLKHQYLKAGLDLATHKAQEAQRNGKLKLAIHQYRLALKELLTHNSDKHYDQLIAQYKATIQQLELKEKERASSEDENLGSEWDEFGKEEQDWKQKQQYDE